MLAILFTFLVWAAAILFVLAMILILVCLIFGC